MARGTPAEKLYDEKAVQALADSYVVCRVMRHRFEQIPDDGGVKRQFKESGTVHRVTKRCETCGAIRREAWSRITGEILFAAYEYPKGYLLKAGSGAKPWNMRIEYMNRHVGRPRKR